MNHNRQLKSSNQTRGEFLTKQRDKTGGEITVNRERQNGGGAISVNSERQNRGAIFVNIERQNRGAISVNIERQNGEGRSISVNRERPKRGGRFLLTKRDKTGGKIYVNFTVKQPLPVPGSGYHILSVNPCSFFLSSHSVTRASSRGREEEKPRVRGNRGMGE